MNKLLCALLLYCVSSLASGEEYSGRVISVLDGDTVVISRDDHLHAPIKIRLANIDAPEKDQEYGMASKQSLLDMVLNKPVRIVTQAVDDFGRVVATLSIGDLKVNHAQVQRGWAWENSRFHGSKVLMAMQHEAQQNRLGLWAGNNPVEPYIWRKKHATLPVENLTVQAQNCVKRSCAQLKTCENARQYFLHCGVVSLDGDRDGAPCENLCSIKK